MRRNPLLWALECAAIGVLWVTCVYFASARSLALGATAVFLGAPLYYVLMNNRR
jgi:hypothetical protein